MHGALRGNIHLKGEVVLSRVGVRQARPALAGRDSERVSVVAGRVRREILLQ